MIYEYSGVDRTGKSTLAVGDIIRTCENDKEGYFKYEDFWGNTAIFKEGYHHVDNNELLDRLLFAMQKKQQHIGFFLDEASGILPARGYGDKRQIEAIKGIWQNEKLFLRLYIVTNTGNSIDTMFDQAMHITFLPRYVEEQDTIYFRTCFRRFLVDNVWRVRNVRSGIQQYFNSWQPVK